MSGDNASRIFDLQKQLVEEFGGKVDRHVVEQSLQAAMDSYASARIRDFVPLFIYRETRERLRQRPAAR